MWKSRSCCGRRTHGAEGQTDGQLLGQFLARRDEAAFAALVRRHGPMVLGVCRRLLRDTHDAEDAFQATFIVLVRKAASLTSRAVLGDWLHGVARRTALNARRTAARRRHHEKAMARSEAPGEEVDDDRLSLLDEALSRLPEKYRLPIVLCELEGRTRREAAERLGWPEGTVAGRLARGRALLARRLLRQGLALPVATLTAGFSVATAFVPAPLVLSTLKAAMGIAAGPAVTTGALSAPVAALAEGVLRSMFLTKLKLVVVVLFLTALLGAGGTASVFAYRTRAAEPEAVAQAAEPKKDKGNPETAERNKPAPSTPARKPSAPAALDKDDIIRPGDLLDIRARTSCQPGPSRASSRLRPAARLPLVPSMAAWPSRV